MASSSFAELQQSLATWILDGRDVGLENRVAVPPRVDVATRLGVYRGGYPARFREALLEVFPAVAKILGDGSLDSMLERYRPHAPTGWCNLNSVGRALPEFLRSDPLTEMLPFLPDLARFEWCVRDCFHARVGEPFDLGSVSDWKLEDWAAVRIAFQPGVALVSSRWPIHELWMARERERSEIDVDLVDRPQSVWIYRRGYDVATELLDDVEAGIARSLLAGRTLADVMHQMEPEGADTGRVLGWFTRIATLGLVAACHRASTSD